MGERDDEQADPEPDLHADGRDFRRRKRKILDNRRSVFLAERLSREPQRRRTIRRRKGV